MDNDRLLRAAACAALASWLLAGCDDATKANAERDAKNLGAKLDSAMDKTGQKLSEAAQKTGDKISEASADLKPKVEAAGDKISDAADKTGQKITQATTNITSGDRTSVKLEGVSDDTRAKLGDAAITASIKADQLKDPDLSAIKIDVDTRDGVVTLNGVVKDEAAKKRAEQLAQATKGVKEVRSHLTVKAG